MALFSLITLRHITPAFDASPAACRHFCCYAMMLSCCCRHAMLFFATPFTPCCHAAATLATPPADDTLTLISPGYADASLLSALIFADLRRHIAAAIMPRSHATLCYYAAC